MLHQVIVRLAPIGVKKLVIYQPRTVYYQHIYSRQNQTSYDLANIDHPYTLVLFGLQVSPIEQLNDIHNSFIATCTHMLNDVSILELFCIIIVCFVTTASRVLHHNPLWETL